jgi:hypothetical protein
MGEDFIRKTEKSYRPSMQRTVSARLMSPPLLRPEERTMTTYSCQLVAGSGEITSRPHLLLHRRPDRTIEILDEHSVIALVEGEPCDDLNRALDKLPGSADMVPIDMVQTDGAFMDFKIHEEDGE